jgi:hypothetical protein
MNRHERRAAQKKLQATIVRGVAVLDRTEVPEGKCDTCGAENQELRPYGPKGEWICFSCGMKDEPATAKQYNRVVFGDAQN